VNFKHLNFFPKSFQVKQSMARLKTVSRSLSLSTPSSAVVLPLYFLVHCGNLRCRFLQNAKCWVETVNVVLPL
jgi:hypothetical protein